MLQGTVAAIVLAWTFLGYGFAFPQASAETVDFLIPADQNQPEPPSGPNDTLIFIGGKVTTMDASGCERARFRCRTLF